MKLIKSYFVPKILLEIIKVVQVLISVVHCLPLINTAMGIYGPHFCKGFIDAVWCDNFTMLVHRRTPIVQTCYTRKICCVCCDGFLVFV